MGADAFERALEALAHKERTSVELERWLAARGFEEAEIAAVIGRLAEIGELDDTRFARRFAADKRELRGWGPERIREALAGRGLTAAEIAAAIADDDPAEQVDRAIGLLEKRGERLDDDGARARALAYLARRGYDTEAAYAAVRRVAGLISG